jgi:DNA-binding response OmpR family regulator
MKKILVIEDCKVSQQHLSQILGKTYEIEFQEDGFAGIAAATKNSPDLILLDVQLPALDGYQVCRLLKNNDRTKDIPVLFITSMGSEQDRVEGFAVGGEDYIIKPFYIEELRKRVEIHLTHRMAVQQSAELEKLNLFKEMAIAISHELNNPLAAIYGYLHMAEAEAEPASENLQHSFTEIHKNLDRISTIVEKLANASRVAKTSYTMDKLMIDLHNI